MKVKVLRVFPDGENVITHYKTNIAQEEEFVLIVPARNGDGREKSKDEFIEEFSRLAKVRHQYDTPLLTNLNEFVKSGGRIDIDEPPPAPPSAEE